jgi:hypothetical protein
MANDAWSILITSAISGSVPVTVSIGTVCNFEEDSFIILAVDDKATYGNAIVPPNNACGKFYDLLPAEPFIVAIAGATDVCDSVIAEFGHEIKRLKDSRSSEGIGLRPDDIRIAIRNSRRYEYAQFVEEHMVPCLQMSFDDWKKRNESRSEKKGNGHYAGGAPIFSSLSACWGIPRQSCDRNEV